MSIPYRTRRALANLASSLLIFLLVAVCLWLCWLLWLGRYMVYDRDAGAVLDFSQNAQILGGRPAVRPTTGPSVPINYDEEGPAQNDGRLQQMQGYYITGSTLEKDLDAVKTQLDALPAGTPVMVDVKSIYGNFFYSSGVSDRRNGDLDIEAMDALIQYLTESKLYVIARLPAFRDYHYGLSHVSDGIYYASGIGLWMDKQGCYWLNPSSQGTLTYLTQIVSELKLLGFDEVLFYDFSIPEGSNVRFNGDRKQVLADTAQILVTACASETFAVSFTGGVDFKLPIGRSRLYMENVAAANAADIALQTGIEDTAARLVFLAESHDTRFDVYSVMRPLSAAR